VTTSAIKVLANVFCEPSDVFLAVRFEIKRRRVLHYAKIVVIGHQGKIFFLAMLWFSSIKIPGRTRHINLKICCNIR